MVISDSFEKIESFLKEIPPFNLLPAEAVKGLSQTIVIQQFPENEVILCPEGPPTRFLYLIRTGEVHFIISGKNKENGKEIVDQRGEKEFFGVFSLWSNRPSPFTVVAKTNTVCYLLKKEVFSRLLDEHANFLLYFTMGPSKGLRTTLQIDGLNLNNDPDSSGMETDSLLFMTRVREIMKTGVITCLKDHTVLQAARLMSAHRIGALIVLDREKSPLGIFTDGDIRKKVIASGQEPGIPVAQIMTSPLLSVTPDAFYFEALLTMIRHRIKYLPILDGGKLVGILSERDLVVSQGNNPAAVIRRIYQAPDLTSLVRIRKDIYRALKTLINRGWQAKETYELITQLNDHLTIRVIELAVELMEQRRKGSPPRPFVWMAFGSEGRQEQTLCTDQNNALMYSDGEPVQSERVSSYFSALSQEVVKGLERCGSPLSPMGEMASNPLWCQSLGGWKDFFRKWILYHELPVRDMRISPAIFDFRAVHGPPELVSELAQSIEEYIRKSKFFLSKMALKSLAIQTPLNFFNRLVVQKSGVHKNKINIKFNGLIPLVDAVRILALEHSCLKTNTLERIETLYHGGFFSAAENHDLREAFTLIMFLLLQHHLEQSEQGQPPDDYINPDDLSLIQQSVLKTAFKSIAQLQGRIEARFGLSALKSR